MTQPESGTHRPTEAVHIRSFSMEPQQENLLTALALLDEASIGDEVRSAVADYDTAPYELRFCLSPTFRAFLSHHPDRSIMGRKVLLSYTSEELVGYERLSDAAARQGLHLSIGMFAVLGKYIEKRCGNPEEIAALVEQATARLQPH